MLVLILADSDTLVTQVCPTNLVEMTRGCLRRTFASLIPKKIFTLEFERGNVDTDVVRKLQSKLDSARRHGGVVCSPPECIKSLELKFVELLHTVSNMKAAIVEGGLEGSLPAQVPI